MFILRKKVAELEKRIADLEGQVQGQQKISGSTITVSASENSLKIKAPVITCEQVAR